MAQVTAPGRPASPERPSLASTVQQQDADPARGRSRTRYPSHLAADGQRKPYLHRRGTSKTLESLEDLLREAGYKETRVFSAAESEAAAAAADDPASRASGVSAAVVGFIAGLIPLTTRSLGRSAGQAVVAAGHAPGPTIRVDPPQSQPQSRPESRGSSKTSRASSRAGDSASSSMTIRPNDFLRPTHSTPGPASNQYRSMRSTVLLRHAASSPAMARSKSHSAPRRKRPHGSGSKHVPPVPPVPPVPDTWMSALTKAFGASAGSPFGDRTNAANSSSTPIRIHRPMPASSAVSRTSVTCRSTPASRSSSTARAPPPLLTLIRTENDEWVASQPPADADAGDDSFMHEEDDDDDDSEVTLERILAPHALARRQRSICSLRRNLQTSMTQARAERRSRNGSDEFDEGFPILGPSAAAQSRPVKKRRALPSWGPDDV